jgi:hypothetical protein
VASIASALKIANEITSRVIEEATDDGFDPLEHSPEECQEWLQKQRAQKERMRELISANPQA